MGTLHTFQAEKRLSLRSLPIAETVTTPTGLMIADDFFHAACVNGVVVGSGLGRDVMGHPLETVAWLAERARSLKRRQLVLTGATIPPIRRKPFLQKCRVDQLGRLAACLNTPATSDGSVSR